MEHLGQLWAIFRPGQFSGVFLGVGDSAGFLAARRVREEDRGCEVVLIDDTQRYVVNSYRIHVTDYVLRPLTRERVDRSMDRILRRRA